MKKFKKSLAMVLALSSAFIIMPENVKAEKVVKASLPGFNVKLNDRLVDNNYSEYPLIVYKDITYFPMTYNTARFLGIETNWSENSGLSINQTGVSGAFDFYSTNKKNDNTYAVSVPEFKIKVNGKEIDNKKEEYPLIVFRDITYFPMTWRFCVNEFNWDYEFTNKKGLEVKSLNTKEKDKVEVKEEKKEEEWKDYSKTIFYNGNYYVVKNKGEDYRLFRESHIGKESKMVSDIPIKDFKQEDDKLFFYSEGNPYYYDLKKGRVVELLKNSNAKEGSVITIGDEVFYVDKKDGELYNKDKDKLNKGNKVENISKDDEYLIVNFEDTKYKFIVYNKKGEEVYKSKDKIKDAKIKDDKLTFYNIDKNKEEEVKLKK